MDVGVSDILRSPGIPRFPRCGGLPLVVGQLPRLSHLHLMDKRVTPGLQNL